MAAASAALPRDGWLSPVELEVHVRRARRLSDPDRRASDRGFLPLAWPQYLQLLDWTGRQARGDKRGVIPAELAPILERLYVSSETWVDMVVNFGRWFGRAAGRAESLAAEATRRGVQWVQGISHSRAAFAR